MKKISKVLLAGLLAASIAGASTAVAFLVSGASLTPESGSGDTAVKLAWGSSKEVSDITSLTPSSPAYRYVTVDAPEKSSTVADPTIKFAVSKGEKAEETDPTPEIYGLKVEVATSAWTESTTATATIEVTEKGQTTGLDASITVTAASSYYLKVTISQAAYNEYTATTPTIELNGTITISYGNYTA